MSYKRKKQISEVTKTIVAIVLFILMMFPLYWMITTSFKDETSVFATPIQWFPIHPTLEAYSTQLTSTTFNIFNGLKNSLIIASCAMLISVLVSIPAAYGLARFNLKGRKIILLIFIERCTTKAQSHKESIVILHAKSTSKTYKNVTI